MDNRENLRRYQDGQIDNLALLRLLASGQWYLPAVLVDGQSRPQLRQIGEERRLGIFTSPDALAEHLRRASIPGEMAWIEVPGERVFASLNEGLAGLDLDPDLDHALSYSAEQFPLLRAFAEALVVERLLREQPEGDDGRQVLRESSYTLAFIDDPQGTPQIALAPDASGRTLAAVFTAPDAAARFTRAAEEALGKPLMIKVIDGARLFNGLGQMPLDGVVFNPLGPPAPVAVGMGFIRALGAG